MNFHLFSSPKILKERYLHRRSFQIAAFVGILALTSALIIAFQFYFGLESFLPYGYLGISLLTLICSATIIFPLPAGEAALIPAASVLNPFWLGLIAGIGSTLGELTGYLAGYWGKKVVAEEYLGKYQKAESWMNRYGGLTIFVFALVPFFIFDLAGLAAGAFRYPLWKFLLFCCAGRIIRCLIVTYLGWSSFQPFF